MDAILIIDDSESERRSLAELVRSEGFEVVEGATLKDARRLLEQCSNFALLLCDHMLPDGRGSQLIDDLADQQPELPAFLVTGSIGAPELEGRELIPKPISIPQLLEVLDAVRD